MCRKMCPQDVPQGGDILMQAARDQSPRRPAVRSRLSRPCH